MSMTGFKYFCLFIKNEMSSITFFCIHLKLWLEKTIYSQLDMLIALCVRAADQYFNTE